MTANEDQEMELEALRSIYEGDECFKEISSVSFQFRIGELEDFRAFMLDVSWPETYPESAPQMSLDGFFNNRIAPETKQLILTRLEAEAESNLGTAMMYTLFEWAKDNQQDLMENHQPVSNTVTAVSDNNNMTSNAPAGKKREKKEQLSKSQKRRITSRTATRTVGCLRILEEKHRAEAGAELALRQETQQRLSASAANTAYEQLRRFEERLDLKRRQERQSETDAADREAREIAGRREKLKEEQTRRTEILQRRLREAEQQRQREEAEADRRRQAEEEGRERLRKLNTIQEEILKLGTLVELKTGPAAASDTPSYVTRAKQLCSQVSEVVRGATAAGEFPSDEDVAAVKLALQEARDLVKTMQEASETQEMKRKEEEEEEARRKKQQEEQKRKKAAASVPAPEEKAHSQGNGLQEAIKDGGTLQWYQDLQDNAARCESSFRDLSDPKDLRTKTLRRELQKAAAIPVSQISSVSGSTLRDVHDKLDALLRGASLPSTTTASAGASFSAYQHPAGRNYVAHRLAEKFVRQGEEEVASHHEAAFPIAAVASGLWEKHPSVGELFLAHLHRKCPYAVPRQPPPPPPPAPGGTTASAEEERRRLLGYRVDSDGGIEGQDAFLKRMSGMMRLYAAIMQQRWPHGGGSASPPPPHPHGLSHAWRWLAETLNGEPTPDVTATLLLDVLEVCGHALEKQYQGQFWKMLRLLRDEYLPRIQAAGAGAGATGHTAGAVVRLREFLETSLRSRRVLLPKGQLSSAFWKS